MSDPVVTGILDRFRLDRKVAVVTGAGRGIGRGIAVALAQAGADVAVISRSTAELDSLAGEIEGLGRRCWALTVDVTDAERFEAALAELPGIDILVGCAGFNIPQPFTEVSERNYDDIFAVNVRAAFFNTQYAAKRMIADGIEGSIVLVSSQTGHVGALERSVYSSTKHALEGLAKTAALDLAKDRIRVNTVAPTYVYTPLTEGIFAADPELHDGLAETIPLGGIGHVDDVVGAVVYLGSDAARLVTGTSIRVDGGYTAR